MMDLGMFFVASQCFSCQVLSNHPGKGTSSLKMSKTMKTTFTTEHFLETLLHCITQQASCNIVEFDDKEGME